MKRIVITGGHHSSAIPILTELKHRIPDVEIHWIGHKHSSAGDKNPTLEYREITSLGYPFKISIAGKFWKTLNPLMLVRIPLGFMQAFFYLMRLRPDFILSFGGYIAVPVVIVGKFFGIPSVTHEQTAVAGVANRLLSKFVNRVLYTWDDSLEFFKGVPVAKTGLPLRESIYKDATDEFVVNEALPTIYITGGKTGSHMLNQAVMNNLEELLKFTNVIHQTGDHSAFDDYEALGQLYKKVSQDVPGIYVAKKFVLSDTIGEAYSKAHLVVARSGAHTCYEILALEKPALLIPLKWVSHNEQYKNAKAVHDAGLAEIFDEDHLNEKSAFLDSIKMTLNRISEYKLNSQGLVVQDAASRIVNEILNVHKETKKL